MNKNILVIVRHGESQWNKENRFTGWVDTDLSENGQIEAKRAGKLLKNKGYLFDYAYTSVLKRAIHTLWRILDELDQAWIPVEKSWRLNERHYGALQGMNKDEVANKYGYEQVQQWRRSFLLTPPPLTINKKKVLHSEARYSKLTIDELPVAESLASTVNRIIPYWTQNIMPRIKKGERVIVVAHGNSIRAMIKFLEDLSEEDIAGVNVPTATPLIYEFDQYVNMNKRYFLNY